MPKILIVDDNDDIRDLISQWLEKRGFETTLAADGKQAIELIEQEQLDLILMDMNMPELDGWEATRLIREKGNPVPVIALTAHAMSGDRERALQAGCSEYHTKPVELDQLLNQIQQLLNQVIDGETQTL